MRHIGGLFCAGILLALAACGGSTESPTYDAAGHADANDRAEIRLGEVPKLITNRKDPKKSPAKAAFEGHHCSPQLNDAGFDQSDCARDLVCVPDALDLGEGTCRVSCDHGGTCPKGRSCQKMFTSNGLGYGEFCLPVQQTRDEACSAFESENACDDGMTCMAGSFAKDKKTGESHFTSLICRATCQPGTPNADASCPQKPDPEICIRASYDAGKARGLCVVPVPLAKASDIRLSGRYVGPTCNERHGHHFCDRRSFEKGDDKAEAQCVGGEHGGPGLCLAVCGQEELDEDSDGKLDGDEKGFSLKCPAGYECSKRLPRALGIVRLKYRADKPEKVKICNTALCKRGKPCPHQCGKGDKSECLPKEPGMTSPEGYCGVVIGHCEAVGLSEAKDLF